MFAAELAQLLDDRAGTASRVWRTRRMVTPGSRKSRCSWPLRAWNSGHRRSCEVIAAGSTRPPQWHLQRKESLVEMSSRIVARKLWSHFFSSFRVLQIALHRRKGRPGQGASTKFIASIYTPMHPKTHVIRSCMLASQHQICWIFHPTSCRASQLNGSLCADVIMGWDSWASQSSMDGDFTPKFTSTQVSTNHMSSSQEHARLCNMGLTLERLHGNVCFGEKKLARLLWLSFKSFRHFSVKREMKHISYFMIWRIVVVEYLSTLSTFISVL